MHMWHVVHIITYSIEIKEIKRRLLGHKPIYIQYKQNNICIVILVEFVLFNIISLRND